MFHCSQLPNCLVFVWKYHVTAKFWLPWGHYLDEHEYYCKSKWRKLRKRKIFKGEANDEMMMIGSFTNDITISRHITFGIMIHKNRTHGSNIFLHFQSSVVISNWLYFGILYEQINFTRAANMQKKL